MRRAARVDGNHGEIRDAFRQCGCLVQSLADLGRGVPDLLVTKHGIVALVEVKRGRGQLTPDQVEWHGKGWPVWVVREVADVPRVVAAMHPTAPHCASHGKRRSHAGTCENCQGA